MFNSLLDIVKKIVEVEDFNISEYMIIDRNKGTHQDIVPLIEKFSSNEKFDIFNEKMHCVGVTATGMSYEYLALWLIKRAHVKGAEQAVKELDDYISNDTFEVYKVMWLNGLWVSTPIDIGDDIELINIIHFPVESYRERFLMKSFDLFSSLTPDSVIIGKFEHKKIYLSQHEKMRPENNVEDFQYYDDLRLLLAMVREDTLGVQSIGTSIVIPDNIPTINGFSYSLSNYRKPKHAAALIDIEVKSLLNLYCSFNERTNQEKDRIRIVLNKLNEYTTYHNHVDMAISIRLMMETLFLDESSQGELSYQLALRVSKLFGIDFDDRLDLLDKLKKIYGICSKAVHNGYLKPKDEKKARELFPIAIKMIRRMILRLIDGEVIDWNKIILD